MADTSIALGRLELTNPVLAASGAFGFGFEYARLFGLDRIGGIVLKSLTVRPRAGNPPPRIAETAAGMINSIGLENPGLDAFADRVLPRLAALPTVKIASFAGDAVPDFAELARALGREPALDAIEINVSCPNQAAGGMAFGTDPAATAEVTAAVRAHTSKPLLVKLTPAAPDLPAVAAAAAAEGADAITVANTYPALAVDWRARKPLICGIGGRGGLSGPAIKPLALRLVAETYRRTGLPIVASGGISSAADAMEFIVAGARAVQVGTATFVNPLACVEIAEGLGSLLDLTHEPRLAGWVGSLKA